MKKHFDTVLNARGEPVAGIAVKVYLTGTNTLATLYADASGAQTKANPTSTDANGLFWCYVADGRYDIEFSGVGFTSQLITDVLISEAGGSGGGTPDPGSVSPASLEADFLLPADQGGTGVRSLGDLSALLGIPAPIPAANGQPMTTEFGTFVPELFLGATQQASAGASGVYVRLGSITLFALIYTLAGAKSGSGNASLSVPIANSFGGQPGMYPNPSWAMSVAVSGANLSPPSGHAISGTSSAEFGIQLVDAITLSAITDAHLGASCTLRVSGWYVNAVQGLLQ